MTETTAETLQTSETTLLILEALKENDGMRISELAQELSLSKSTVHRHITTLLEHEYIIRNGDLFEIGLRFLSMGMYARRNWGIQDTIKSKVAQLAEETGEIAHYTTEEHGKIVVLHREQGKRAVKMNVDLGRRGPLHASASGKAILAEKPDRKVEQYIQQNSLDSVTSATIRDTESLFEELNKIRERGYSVNREEFMEGLNAVAVAITAPDSDTLGAISIVGPTNRLHGEQLESDIPDLLLGTAHEIELNLKYSN